MIVFDAMTRPRAVAIGLVAVGMAAAGGAYWYATGPPPASFVFRPLSGSWTWVSTYGTDRMTGACEGLPAVQRTAKGPATVSAATDGTSFRLDIDGQTVLFHRLGASPRFETGRSSFPIGSPAEGRSGDVWFEATVDSTSSITGSTKWTAFGCEADYPFTLTLDTAYEPDGVVPDAGLWQMTAGPGPCATGVAEFFPTFSAPATLSLDMVTLTLAPGGGAPILLSRNGPLTWSGTAVVNAMVGGVPQVFAGTMHVTFTQSTRAVATFVGNSSTCGTVSSITMTRIG